MSSSGKELNFKRRRGGDGQKEIMEYGSPNDPTVEKFNDSSMAAVVRRHKTPKSVLRDFLPIKAKLQRQTGFLIDREYASVVLRVFVQLVCTGARSMDMDREIKRHAHDIFSRFSVPIASGFKEKPDETVDDGMGDFDRTVSMFAQQVSWHLGKLANLLSNEQRLSQHDQISHLSLIKDSILDLWAKLGMPHEDAFLKPESRYIDLVFPRVVVRWGCRSALIVYSRIKKELQRQVGELINREDNCDELWLCNYYGVSSELINMEDAIRTSTTKIFKRYFGRIPQWYKKKEAERTDEMKDETDDETDDEIEDFNLNVSLYCEDICRQVEELLGLVSVDKSPQIEQLLRIAYHIEDFKRNLAKVGWMPVEEEIVAEGMEIKGEAEEEEEVGWMPVEEEIVLEGMEIKGEAEEEEEEIVAEGMEIKGEAEEEEIVAEGMEIKGEAEEEEEIVAEGMGIKGEVVVSGTVVTMTKVRSSEQKQDDEMSSVKKHEDESERAWEETSSVKKHEEQSERAGEE